MVAFLRAHVTTIAVAMATAAVTAGGPALAAAVAQAVNADKVDGRHAVGAGATTTQRKGKLVATNTAGRLPNNIITKAPNADKLDGINSTGFLRKNAKAADADKLDGKDSSAFQQVVLPPGGVLTGTYGAFGTGVEFFGDVVSFGVLVPAGLASGNVHFREAGAAATANCPGVDDAAPGHLCVYEGSGFSSSFQSIFTPRGGDIGADPEGFGIYWQGTTSGNSHSYGTWTLRRP